MRHELYLRVDGDDRDARHFYQALPEPIGEIKLVGHLSTRHRSALVWKSPVLDGSGDLDADINTLLDAFPAAVNLVLRMDGVHPTVQVVQHFVGADDPPGVWLSSNTLQRLAAMKAELDVDSVHDLRT